jgi:GT2 family glycosyltransferase
MELSIIIIACHLPGRTQACIESLERTVRRVRWEGILTGEAEAPYRSAPDPNAAAELARAPMLCFLHGDAVLMPGWLEPMRRAARRERGLACIGNVQREPYSGLIDHAGIQFDGKGLPIHACRDEAVPPRAEFTRWPAVSKACFLVPKDLFLRLGGFDLQLGGDFQAADFCLRAASAGYHHLVANRSMIYHRGEDEPVAGAALFQERWGRRIQAYWTRRESGNDEGAWRERWEASRETRRQLRQDIRDAAADGRRYLKKHLARPWRYNFGRVCQALMRAVHPLPAPIPPPPRIRQTAGGEYLLFDPPRQ